MSVALSGVLFFLAASLLLYLFFGGADFGAGILELFLGKTRRDEQRRLISYAMAPVWEANHIWLVLAVVILLMGFPSVYTTITTHLYIPLMAVLVGIVGRGCAFTFRHYDTLTSRYYKTFSLIFSLSSLWTSFFLGVILGALTLGKIHPEAVGFHEAYIAPWCNGFAFATGLFTCCLFAFLAAVYLAGETQDAELRKFFLRRARTANLLWVLAGSVVFLSAQAEGFALAALFLDHPVSFICFAIATSLLIPLWLTLRHPERIIAVRVFGVGFASLVLIGWFAVQFPLAIRTSSVEPHIGLSFLTEQAPPATLRALLLALIIGSALIFPALGYLFKVFKWHTLERERQRYRD